MSNQQKILDLPEEYKSRVKIEGKTATVDSEGLYYKDLNCILRKIVCNSDVEKLVIQNVCGQRYIGTDLNKNLQIEIHGTPGNDLGAFMSGPKVIVHGSAQDASGNTMDEGEIIVEGHAGDLTGHSMRGGKILSAITLASASAST
jgi:glutamate synthase domain-containing protein 3